MFKNTFSLVISILFLNGCVTALSFKDAPVFLKKLDDKTRQVIFVQNSNDTKVSPKLILWEKNSGRWEPVFDPIPAVVGRQGIAALDEKREGDGKTPSGAYSLGSAFGYASSIHTKLDYYQVTENDFWVDDPKSLQYNQWVHATPQANSFERLKRDDDLYKYGLVINYNTDPVVPGKGSAIFLHVWRGQNQPTAGCVAVAEKDIIRILQWLDKDKHPVIILFST